MAARTEVMDDAGEAAPWLTMVHGMSQDRRVFSAQVRAFRGRYRLLLVDLPGHGLSADLPGPFGHAELAAGVVGALEAAGVRRTHYWGTHTGSAVGLLLAVREPRRFRSLILEAPVLPGRSMPVVAEAFERACTTARAEGLEQARRQWFEAVWFDVMRARPRECRAEEHWTIISAFQDRPWTHPGEAAPVAPIDDALRTLATPALIYHGARDHADFIAAADALDTLLPNARRERIAEAGGFPAWELPDRVDALVADFLER